MVTGTANPDFFVVGAAKSGTTSIDRVLRGHPELLLPEGIKETYYWVRPTSVLGNGVGYEEKHIITDALEYQRRFLSRRPERARIKAKGEVCNGYLYFFNETIPNVKEHLGDIKIVIVLRHPVERAYSGYLQLLRDRIVDESFRDALEKEEDRIAEGYWWAFHLYRIGLYHDAVAAYKRHFGEVAVYLFDDFVADRRSFYCDLLTFLGVEASYTLETDAHANRSGLPRNPWIWNALKRESAFKGIAKQVLPQRVQAHIRRGLEENLVRPELDVGIAVGLWRRYLPDVERLSELLDRDLVKLWEIV